MIYDCRHSLFLPIDPGVHFLYFSSGDNWNKKNEKRIYLSCLFFKNIYLSERLRYIFHLLIHSPVASVAGLGQTEARSLELQLGLLCECKDLGALAISYFPGALEGLKVEQRGLELTLPHGICWWRCSHSAITSPGGSLALHQSSLLPPEQSPPTRGAGLELLQEGLPSCPSLVAVTCSVS